VDSANVRYVVKLNCRVHHIAGVQRNEGVHIFPIPHPAWQYKRLILATVHQAELRDRVIQETADLYNTLQRRENELAEAQREIARLTQELQQLRGGGGGGSGSAAAAGNRYNSMLAGMSEQPLGFDPPRGGGLNLRGRMDAYSPYYPSTWAMEGLDPRQYAEFTEQFLLRLGVTDRGSELVQVRADMLRDWARAAADPAGDAFPRLGDALAIQLRLALEPTALRSAGVRAVLRVERHANDPFGAALADARDDEAQRGRGRGDQRGGRGRGSSRSPNRGDRRCHACGAAGQDYHPATQCPDKAKRDAYEAVMKNMRPGNGRGGGYVR
jgi:hypothetical protein